jgi:hypothetical protein
MSAAVARVTEYAVAHRASIEDLRHSCPQCVYTGLALCCGKVLLVVHGCLGVEFWPLSLRPRPEEMYRDPVNLYLRPRGGSAMDHGRQACPGVSCLGVRCEGLPVVPFGWQAGVCVLGLGLLAFQHRFKVYWSTVDFQVFCCVAGVPLDDGGDHRSGDDVVDVPWLMICAYKRHQDVEVVDAVEIGVCDQFPGSVHKLVDEICLIAFRVVHDVLLVGVATVSSVCSVEDDLFFKEPRDHLYEEHPFFGVREISCDCHLIGAACGACRRLTTSAHIGGLGGYFFFFAVILPHRAARRWTEGHGVRYPSVGIGFVRQIRCCRRRCLRRRGFGRFGTAARVTSRALKFGVLVALGKVECECLLTHGLSAVFAAHTHERLFQWVGSREYAMSRQFLVGVARTGVTRPED